MRALEECGMEIFVVSLFDARVRKASEPMASFAREIRMGIPRVLNSIRTLLIDEGLVGCEQVPSYFSTQLGFQIAKCRPDILVADMLWMWPSVQKVSDGIPVVYLEHNIEAEVASRLRSQSKGVIKVALLLLLEAITRRLEDNAWRSVSAIWAVSQREADSRPQMAKDKTSVVVNSLPFDRFGISDSTRKKRFTLLFVGAMSYRPNRDGLRWFIEEVFKSLAELETNISIAVLGGSGKCPDFLNHPQVNWLGFQEDIVPIYSESQVIVAPIMVGGGTKFKVLEALQLGCRIIASPHAVEGLVPGHYISVAQSPVDWVREIKRFLTDNSTTVGSGNRQYYLENYDWRKNISSIERSVDRILQHKPSTSNCI